MVGARLPQHVAAPHALKADQHVLQREGQRVPHMQAAGDVRRRHHDRVGRPAAVGIGGKGAGLLPQRVEARLDGRWNGRSCPASPNFPRPGGRLPSARGAALSAARPHARRVRSPRAPAARRSREDACRAMPAIAGAKHRGRSPRAPGRHPPAAARRRCAARAAGRRAGRRPPLPRPRSRPRGCARVALPEFCGEVAGSARGGSGSIRGAAASFTGSTGTAGRSLAGVSRRTEPSSLIASVRSRTSSFATATGRCRSPAGLSSAMRRLIEAMISSIEGSGWGFASDICSNQ